MSRAFFRGHQPTGRPVTPARLGQQFFTKGKDNFAPVDFTTAWRQWSAWKSTQTADFVPRAIHVLRTGPEYKQKRLVNKWARARQTGEPKYFEPESTFNPANPYRPSEEWPEAAAEDEKHTQYHERYEYPLIPVDPWACVGHKKPRPTSAYWPQPPEKTWMERGLEHPHDPHPRFNGLTYCILRKDIDGLGVKHDVVAVHQDQFRYDLHPNRLAVVATRENCSLLGVAFDALYQDYPRREQQGKLMHRQPWVWDQLQGMPWDEFTRPDEDETAAERDQPWDGEIPRPIFAAEMIARRKEESAAKKAEKEAAEAKIKERKRGAATQMFTL